MSGKHRKSDKIKIDEFDLYLTEREQQFIRRGNNERRAKRLADIADRVSKEVCQMCWGSGKLSKTTTICGACKGIGTIEN